MKCAFHRAVRNSDSRGRPAVCHIRLLAAAIVVTTAPTRTRLIFIDRLSLLCTQLSTPHRLLVDVMSLSLMSPDDDDPDELNSDCTQLLTDGVSSTSV